MENEILLPELEPLSDEEISELLAYIEAKKSSATETPDNNRSEKKNQPGKIGVFTSFDLSEENGGPQMIIDYRAVSPTEYYVKTLGDGPKNTENEVNKEKSETEKNNIKIRYFKLTLLDDKKCAFEEYVTPKSICAIIKYFLNTKDLSS